MELTYLLVGHSRHVVSGLAQRPDAAASEILIQLEPHAVFFTDTSTKRSRDISDP
jgi:hypothetical protein